MMARCGGGVQLRVGLLDVLEAGLSLRWLAGVRAGCRVARGTLRARCFLVFWCVVKICGGAEWRVSGDRAKIRDVLHTDFWCVDKIGWRAARCHLARGAIAHRWVSRGAVRVCDDIALGAIHSSDVLSYRDVQLALCDRRVRD